MIWTQKLLWVYVWRLTTVKLGGIPKTRRKEEIEAELRRLTDQIENVIIYPSAADKNKNRGFAFVEYTTHRLIKI